MGSLMGLTWCADMGYSSLSLANSSDGIDPPHKPSVSALVRSTLFFRPLYGGTIQATFGLVAPWRDRINLFRSISNGLIPFGGGFKTLAKESIMTSKTKCVPAQDYKTLLSNHYDTTTLSRAYLENLHALFTAIVKDSAEYSQTKELAHIGQYLADEWIDMFNGEAKQLQIKQTEVRS